MDLRKQIVDRLKESTGVEEVQLETPENAEFGDFSSNVALQDKSGNPKRVAEEIVDKLQKDKKLSKIVDKINIAGPGFINFWLKKDVLIDNLLQVNKDKEDYGKSDTGKGKKVMVEFAHPNTHKAFHIGHMRNITIGESIVRLLEANGYQIIRSNYQGDVGMHIAKAMYGLLNTPSNKEKLNSLNDTHERVEFLGSAYAVGSKAYEEDEKAKQIIHDYNFLVYASAQRYQTEQGKKQGSTDYLSFVRGQEKKLDEVYEIWKSTRQWSLDYFETIYQRVGTHFDRYYFESECLVGVDLARDAVTKGVLKESEGAIIFDGEPLGLDVRVFVNNLGLPTYEAKELALANLETSEFGELNKIIHVVGPEQTSFFKVTFKVEELLDEKRYKDKQFHLVYGWVRLKHGKMSSRLGNVVLGEDLLNESKKEITEILEGRDYDQSDKENISEQAAVAAVKYSFLKPSTLSEIAFDIKESIDIQGNSGPYLQYTYARTQSVAQKAGETNLVFSIGHLSLNEEEFSLLRTFIRFPGVIADAAKSYSPNLLCEYLFDLAQKYNTFYNKHKIIGSGNEQFRLAVNSATGQILKNGLYLLGIQAPEHM